MDENVHRTFGSRTTSRTSIDEKTSLGSAATFATLDCIVFDEGSPLLRATPLADILQYGGRILAHSAGSAESYKLSRPCERIDVFLSHNWSTHHSLKFLAFCMHFNFGAAFGISAIMLLLAFGLAACVDLTDIVLCEQPWDPDLGDELIARPCSLVGVPVFLTAMATWHSVRRCFLRAPILCFLDKTCIHQIDTHLKREGIQKLGAFLQKSERFVVCYTHVYLTKLWTVYELACWTLLSDSRPMVLVPPRTAITFLILHVLFYVHALGQLLLQTGGDIYFAVLLMVVTVFLLEIFAQGQLRVQRRLSNFRLTDTTCYCENDRPLVENNIIRMMRFRGICNRHASRDEILNAFEKLVQEYVKCVVYTSSGHRGFKYVQFVALLVLSTFARELDIVAYLLLHHEIKDAVLRLLGSALFCFAFLPLVLAVVAMILTNCLLSLHAWRFVRCMFVFVVASCFAMAVYAGWRLTYWGIHEAAVSNLALVLFLLTYVVIIILVHFAYKQYHFRPVLQDVFPHMAEGWTAALSATARLKQMHLSLSGSLLRSFSGLSGSPVRSTSALSMSVPPSIPECCQDEDDFLNASQGLGNINAVQVDLENITPNPNQDSIDKGHDDLASNADEHINSSIVVEGTQTAQSCCPGEKMFISKRISL